MVCALALTHVPELAPVLAEALPDGGHGYMPHYMRATSEYLQCALPLAFQVRSCEEWRTPWLDPNDASPAERVLPEHPSDIWTLRDWCPAAARAALSGRACLIFWHFQLG